MRNKGCYITGIRTVVFIIAMLCSAHAIAQEREPMEYTNERAEKRNAAKKESGTSKLKRFTKNTVSFVNRLLNTVDTTYVELNKYYLTFMPEYSYNYEHYSFGTSSGEKQSISIAPDSRSKMTFNIGWRRIFIGYTVDLQKSHPHTDFKVNLYTPRFGLDLFYRKSSEGYKIRSLTGFYDGNKPLQNYNNNFDGLTVKQHGISIYHVFNKRFSYPAANRMSTIQRMSAGSFIIGAGYKQQEFIFDYESLDPLIRMQLKDELKFKDIVYKDFTINVGYGYNWVFARNFLASMSLTPAIGYKSTSLILFDRKSLLSSINIDLTARASVVYNNGRYFAGVSMIAHTYYYKKSQLTVVNGFGMLNVSAGVNFWRKKKKSQ